MPRLSELAPSERPRERLLRLGAGELSDAELLTIVLGGSLDVAVALRTRFADLGRLAGAGIAELVETRGVGLAQACRLKAALALGGRLARPFRRGEPLGGPAAVYAHLGGRLAPMEREVFMALSLDAKNRILAEHRLAEGGVCSVEVLPRDVFAAIVREAAAAVVFVHNHPSGDPRPSSADEELTRRLTAAGQLVGVTVLDHVIVARGGYWAFSTRGSPGNFGQGKGVG